MAQIVAHHSLMMSHTICQKWTSRLTTTTRCGTSAIGMLQVPPRTGLQEGNLSREPKACARASEAMQDVARSGDKSPSLTRDPRVESLLDGLQHSLELPAQRTFEPIDFVYAHAEVQPERRLIDGLRQLRELGSVRGTST